MKAQKLGLGGILKIVFDNVILNNRTNSDNFYEEQYYNEMLYAFLYEELKALEKKENISS